MAANRTQILQEEDVTKMIRRLAFQVYERNFEEKELIIAGINGNGTSIAAMIAIELTSISKIKVIPIDILFDKNNPDQQQIKLSKDIDPANKNILVVDDVLNTARTFVYALIPFIGRKSKSIQTLVLIDRKHRSFPISADYVGMALSTTLQEHIEVAVKGNKVNAYLN